MSTGETHYWETVGAEWDRTRPDALWRSHSDAMYRRLFAAWLPELRGGRLLKTDLFDEAFGAGLYPLLATRAGSVLGMDLSLPTLQAARARIARLPAVCADVRRLPFAGGAFDAVVSNSTLDHFMSGEELVASLRELHRVLRPDGRLLLSLDNPLNPLVALRNALPFALLQRLGLSPYRVGVTWGPRRLRRALQQTGFTVAEIGAALHCPRVLAVKLAGLLQRRAGPATQQWFVRSLLGWERLARWPTRYVTGHYVVVLAVREEGLAASAAPARGGS